MYTASKLILLHENVFNRVPMFVEKRRGTAQQDHPSFLHVNRTAALNISCSGVIYKHTSVNAHAEGVCSQLSLSQWIPASDSQQWRGGGTVAEPHTPGTAHKPAPSQT